MAAHSLITSRPRFTPARVRGRGPPRKEAEAWRVISRLAVSCAGAVDPAVEGRNTMVNAEGLRLDEADTGGIPWWRGELASPGLFVDLGPWQFHLLALQ